MLDRLPIELVEDIVRLALPSPYSPLLYRERQKTLLALCRTSRAMRSLVQPILFEAVEMEFAHGTKPRRFFQRLGAHGELVRKVGIELDEEEENDLNDEEDLAMFHLDNQAVRALASVSPNLVEMRLMDVAVDGASLELFPNLRYLCLSLQAAPSRSFILPALEQLNMQGTDYSEHSVLPFFSRLTAPRLRAVYLPLGTLEARGNFLPELLDKVEMVGTEVYFLWHDPPSAAEVRHLLQPRVLVDIHLSSTFLPPASFLHATQHFRLHFPSFLSPTERDNWVRTEEAEHRAPLVRKLAKEVRNMPNLRTVYLPSNLHPTEARPLKSLRRAVRRLLRACKEREVEVVWESPVHFWLDSLISPEFWRRCRALKEEEGWWVTDDEEEQE
ncbi:hypothetical protein JCM10213_007652 [Rhodosporidiobolus nylandii]